MGKPRRMEIFYTNPCSPPPVIAREKGNVDRKTLLGAAMTRCLCKEISQDEWHLIYEKGKYGRGIHSEFEKALIKIKRLYHGFEKEIVVKINGFLMCNSRGFDDQIDFPHSDLFDESIFKRRRERSNELNRIFKEWSIADPDMISGVNIRQLGIVSDVVFREDFGVQALELMRYKSGIRGSWGLARLRSYGALTSILETARFGLTDGGGIILGHFGDINVERLAEEIQEAFKMVTKTSYPVMKTPLSYWIALINLKTYKLKIRKMLSKNWEHIPFNLHAIRDFITS